MGYWPFCGVCANEGFVGTPEWKIWPERTWLIEPKAGVEKRYEARGGWVYGCTGCRRTWWWDGKRGKAWPVQGDLRERAVLSNALLEEVTKLGVGRSVPGCAELRVPCRVQRKTGEWVEHAVLKFDPWRMGVSGKRETGDAIAAVEASEDALPVEVRSTPAYEFAKDSGPLLVVRRRGFWGRFGKRVMLQNHPPFLVGGPFAGREAAVEEWPRWFAGQWGEKLQPWVGEAKDCVEFECEAGRKWFERWERG